MQTEPIVPMATKGKIVDKDIKAEYLEFQRNYMADISNLNIAIDCSNGMAALLIKDLLGNAPIYIYDELDGSFPNHEPNPLVEENVAELKKQVITNQCDIGVIFDGDADRVMFVDEKGKFISPDLIIGLLAHYFLEEKGLKGNVLQDIRTSKAVAEYISTYGSTMHTWRVGRAFAAIKLREIDGIFGGELAGHYYFRDFYYSDSGIMAALIVLDIVSKIKTKGKTLSELINGIRKYANSGEINFRIEKKQEAMDAVRNYFLTSEKPTANYDFDGYRVEFPEWWFNIRPSNTEPYLRLLAEARTEVLLNQKLTAIKGILKKFE
jgi:phosphomannomutase